MAYRRREFRPLERIRERVDEFRERILRRPGYRPRGTYGEERPAVSPGEELTEEQRRAMEAFKSGFKSGVAGFLGVPEEAIREEVIERAGESWIREWTRAFVKPEWTREMIGSMGRMGEELGRATGQIAYDLQREEKLTETTTEREESSLESSAEVDVKKGERR